MSDVVDPSSDGWEFGMLSDIADVNPDKGSATKSVPEFRYVDISCLGPEGIQDPSSIPLTSRAAAPSRAQRLLRSGDSLVGTVRPERGARGCVPAELNGHVGSTGICVLRPKIPSDVGFIYGVVRDSLFTEWCVNREAGTSYPAVSPDDIGRYPLLLPSASERERIGALLAAIDNRLAAIRSLIKATGHCSQIIVATSPDTCLVSDLASTRRVAFDPFKSPHYHVDHYSLPAFDAGRPDRVVANTIASSKREVLGSSVLLSRLNPETNRTWLVQPEDGVDKSVCSSEYAVLEPIAIPVGLLWAAVSTNDICSELASLVTGTSSSHQRIREEQVLGLEVPDPRSIDSQAQVEAAAMAEAQLRLRREVGELTNLRAFLLPRLLSGELRVSEIEELLEEAL